MSDLVQLRRVFRVVNGGTPSADPDNWDGDVPWATPVDLAAVNGAVLRGTVRRLTFAGLQAGSAVVPAGSLIVSTRAPIGYVARVMEPTAFNQGCRGLVPKMNACERYFAYQLLALRSDLDAAGQGSTFLELSSSQLASIRVLVPSHGEQRRIAAFLDRETARIDALIAKKRRMIDLMRERRSSIYRAAAAGLPLSTARAQCNLAWLDDLPVHWTETKLVRLARLGSGHTPSRERPEWWEDATIPWITTGEVAQLRGDRIDVLSETREMISELGVANSSAEVHPAGTVVLSRTASAGFSAIMGTDMATSQDFVTWTCGEGLDPRFLLVCLRAMRQDLLERLAMGSTHKTIYMPDIASIRVPVPPIDEQDQIVRWADAQLAPVSRTEDALARQIELLQERRRSLITHAVTGQLPIPA